MESERIMSRDDAILKGLLAAANGLAPNEGARSSSPELVAQFLQRMRRSGRIEGRVCYIQDGRGCKLMRGFDDGPWTVIGQRCEDLEDDADLEQHKLEQEPVAYELIPVGVIDDGIDDEPEVVHVIRGMNTADEADQFFNPHFFREWRAVPAEPEGAKEVEPFAVS